MSRVSGTIICRSKSFTINSLKVASEKNVIVSLTTLNETAAKTLASGYYIQVQPDFNKHDKKVIVTFVSAPSGDAKLSYTVFAQ